MSKAVRNGCFQINGCTVWVKDDMLHREDGPAVIYYDGTTQWWVNDELHREDGPAIEWADGVKEYFLYGEKLDKELFDTLTGMT